MILLSHDSKYLFSTNGTLLNVYSVTSGELVYRLNYTENSTNEESNRNEVTIVSICLNPFNKYQLFSFHVNGVVCLWDYEDGLLLKSFKTQIKMKKVINLNSSIYAIGKLKKSDNDSLSLYKFKIDSAIKNKDSIEHELYLAKMKINLEKFQIAIDHNEKYVAYIEGRKNLVFSHFKQNSLTQKYKSLIELTCLAIHPNEDCIATGTITGKIIIWYNYLNNKQLNGEDLDYKRYFNIRPTESVLHWHSLPVLSVSFSKEGSILLSGGHECVLVKWMFKTGQKDFKPRLGAPITDITSSADNTLYATKHLDNTIHLIGANMKVVQTLSSFLCPNFKTTNKELIRRPDFTFYPTGLNYFKKLNCLVTNGKPGHLQFYLHKSDKLLFNLDIVNENYISPENLNRPNIHTEIECLAFNFDSTWLVTIERRDDSITTPEIKLKFWHYDSSNNKFILNTLVRHPHSFDRVTNIKFKPNKNILFTCGQDGCFKSWILVKNRPSSNDPNQNVSNWVYNTCNGYRDSIPNDIEFFDFNNREYLSVSFNHIVTVWRCESDESLSFVDDLIHCSKEDSIKSLKKINNSSLIVVHNECVNVWHFEQISSNKKDVFSDEEVKIEPRCIWTNRINNVVQVEQNPSNSSQVFFFIKENTLETSAKLKISLIEISKSKNVQFKIVHEFNQVSNGLVNFVLVPHDLKKSDEFDLDKLEILYTDNSGIIRKVNKNKSNGDHEYTSEDFLWQNRKILPKNLPESNLVRIIDTNRSNLLNSDKDEFIKENGNDILDSNLATIETTPAYLMPKISSFCLNTLKSMLYKLDEKKYEMQNGF